MVTNHPHIRKQNQPLPTCDTIQDLLTIRPDIVKISLTDPDFASLFRMHPNAIAPDSNELIKFHIGRHFVESLRDHQYTEAANGYWTDWIRPNPPPSPHELALIIIDAYPHMQERAFKAANFVRQRHVSYEDTRHTFLVHGVFIHDEYTVYLPPDPTAWSCTHSRSRKHEPEYAQATTCPDIANDAPFLKHGKRCAHMLAAWMYHTILNHPTLS